MKRTLIEFIPYIFLAILLVAAPSCAHAQAVSSTKISYDGDPHLAITDLKSQLAKYSVGNIKITNTALGERTGQEFYLSIKGNETEIIYTTTNSLQNAIYTYLDFLGFRWYGPTELWQVQPKQIMKKDLQGKWYAPSFRNRQFFGTGGLEFATPPIYDPQNNYRTEWYNFKRRNRFNADFEAAGHMGSAFYLENKNLLDQHPEWFANEQGKKYGRIKIDNKEAVNVFKQYVKDTYKKQTSVFKLINVEPEDDRGGADDPNPKNGFAGISKWNSADKWWWLANEVAKDYDENDKKTIISMYAYGNGKENALAPSFRLRKNVYPILVPYAFQKAYTPEEMIKTWSSKISGKMAVYDYWNITQWSQGLPQFNIKSIPQKLRFWSANKIDGILLETTDAFGPTGPTLWLAGQMQWDLNKNFDSLYTVFFKDCFGNAAAPIKRMYDRWSADYQGAADVAFSLADLKEASSLVVANSKEAMRISSLKAYVHFMKLSYEHDGSVSSRNELYQYMYSIHKLMLVQTAAFVGQQYIMPTAVAPMPKSRETISIKQIETNFQKDLNQTFKPYALNSFVFNFDKVKYKEPLAPTAWLYGRLQSVFFFKAPATETLSLDIGTQSENSFLLLRGNENLLKEDIDKNNFSAKELAIGGQDWYMRKFMIPIKKGETYTIRNSGTFNRLKLNTKGIVLFKNPGSQDFDNYNYPVQYFYVPKNTKEIIFADSEVEGLNGRGYLVAPDGTVNKREKLGAANIYRVVVKAGWDGKLWSANFGHPSWSFKNIPNITALQKFDYQE